MPPLGDARERFSVKFYMVAMLFIIFDIETVFMIPWAPSAASAPARRRHPAGPALRSEMFVFIVILAVGFIYVWKKGALQWD